MDIKITCHVCGTVSEVEAPVAFTSELDRLKAERKDIDELVIPRLRDRAERRLGYAQFVAARAADAERLLYICRDVGIDAIGDMDIHEQASIYASAFGREEANDDDYLAAYRDAIDAARKGGG